MEFQNRVRAEIIEMKEKTKELDLMKEKINQLESENQKCQRNLENITRVLEDSITENKAGIGKNLAMLHNLAINDTTLESIINQINQDTNENFKNLALFTCEEVKGWEIFDSHCYFFFIQYSNMERSIVHLQI